MLDSYTLPRFSHWTVPVLRVTKRSVLVCYFLCFVSSRYMQFCVGLWFPRALLGEMSWRQDEGKGKQKRGNLFSHVGKVLPTLSVVTSWGSCFCPSSPSLEWVQACYFVPATCRNPKINDHGAGKIGKYERVGHLFPEVSGHHSPLPALWNLLCTYTCGVHWISCSIRCLLI